MNIFLQVCPIHHTISMTTLFSYPCRPESKRGLGAKMKLIFNFPHLLSLVILALISEISSASSLVHNPENKPKANSPTSSCEQDPIVQYGSLRYKFLHEFDKITTSFLR